MPHYRAHVLVCAGAGCVSSGCQATRDSLLERIEAVIPNPYGAEGLYRVFAAGFLPVPHLWQCRDDFPHAVRWPTAMVRGSVKVVDARGMPLPARERMRQAAETAGT